jgi:hypothetical protein
MPPTVNVSPLQGDRLGYERDLSSPGPVILALTAFANSAGGLLVFGVDDNRTVLGVEDPVVLESVLGWSSRLGPVPQTRSAAMSLQRSDRWECQERTGRRHAMTCLCQ